MQIHVNKITEENRQLKKDILPKIRKENDFLRQQVEEKSRNLDVALQQAAGNQIVLPEVIDNVLKDHDGQLNNCVAMMISWCFTPAQIMNPLSEGIEKLAVAQNFMKQAWPDLVGKESMVLTFEEELKKARNTLTNTFYREFKKEGARNNFVLMSNDSKKHVTNFSTLLKAEKRVTPKEKNGFLLGIKAHDSNKHKIYKCVNTGEGLEKTFLFERTRFVDKKKTRKSN